MAVAHGGAGLTRPPPLVMHYLTRPTPRSRSSLLFRASLLHRASLLLCALATAACGASPDSPGGTELEDPPYGVDPSVDHPPPDPPVAPVPGRSAGERPPALPQRLSIYRHQQHAEIAGFGSWSDQFTLSSAGELPADLDVAFLRFSVGTERPWSFPTIEPSNDDADPFHIDWARFRFDSRWNDNLSIMKELYETRQIRFSPAMWFYPEWMVDADPDGRNKRLKADMADEAAEHIAAFLLHARDHYGLDHDAIPLISVANEPCPGCHWVWGWRISGSDVRDLILATGRMFDRYGIQTKLIGPTTPHSSELVQMIRPTLEDPEARQYLGAIDFHSYGMGGQNRDATLEDVRAVRQLMAEQGVELPIWDTEMDGQCSDPLTWTKGWNMLIQFIYLLREDVAMLQPNLGDNNCGDRWGGDRGPQSYLFEHFFNHLPVGARRVDARLALPDEELVGVAYAAPEGGLVVQLVNQSETLKELTLEGLSWAGRGQLYRTSEAEPTFVDGGEASYQGGRLDVSLAARSLTTVVLPAGS